MEEESKQPAESFHAVVELFGHQRIAGTVSQHVFGGETFVRVDVSVEDILDDRIADLGGSTGKTVRSRFTRGKWTEPISGTFSMTKDGGPAKPDLTNLDARVYYIAAYELTELQYHLVTSRVLAEFTKASPRGAEAEELCKDHNAKAGKVRSNKPKNERANRKKMAKKAKLAQGLDAKS